MFNITNTQYIIICLLLFIIIVYSIIVYPFIFNQVDIIHYKMKIAQIKPLFNDSDYKELKIAKEYIICCINKLFSGIFYIINYFLKINENLYHFIKSLIYDFIIYV